MRQIIVQDSIFEMFPEFYRGIIIINDFTNHPSLKRVRKELKKAVDEQAGIDIAADERLTVWDKAHREFGSNPNKFLPSIKSLLKRLQKNPALPYINTAVALFNYISIKYCLPCGGDDTACIEGDLVLGVSDGTESFLALGSDKEESPVPGEVIYFDSLTKNVMCRRWNWRNGDKTKITEDSRQLVINIDCMLENGRQAANEARDEMAALLKEHCNADLVTDALHADRPKIEIAI